MDWIFNTGGGLVLIVLQIVESSQRRIGALDVSVLDLRLGTEQDERKGKTGWERTETRIYWRYMNN